MSTDGWLGAGAAVGNIIGGAIQGHKNRKFAKQMWEKQVAQQDKVNAQAMAYQDKVNQENRDWNTEKNVRARIEEAGYNPYLYNGQASASGSNVASAANLGNSVSPVETNVDYGLPNVGTNVMSALRSALDFNKDSYGFKRQKEIDALNDIAQGGVGSTESKKTQAEFKNLQNQSIISSVDAQLAEIRSTVANWQAYDENSMPITDENGRELTVAEAKEYGQMRRLDMEIKNLHADFVNAVTQGEVLDEEKLTKRFYRLNIQPEELQVLKGQISKLVADTKLAIAQKRVADAQESNIKADTGLKKAQTVNTNADTEYRYSATDKMDLDVEAQDIANDFAEDREFINAFNSIRPKSLQELPAHLYNKFWDVLTKSGRSADTASDVFFLLSRRIQQRNEANGNYIKGVPRKRNRMARRIHPKRR